jgi:hypothetical protein
MIVGTLAVFAIESGISQVHERPSLRALGFFVIHVGGFRYGVYEDDSTMLANSFDEVGRRISDQGCHSCPFALEAEAGKIADAVSQALYGDGPDDESFWGMSRSELRKLVSSKDLLWAPDGDAAFDDGSYVLQFDVEERVRLIAFQRPVGLFHEPATLRDVWITTQRYYLTLQQWRDDFEASWTAEVKLAKLGT